MIFVKSSLFQPKKGGPDSKWNTSQIKTLATTLSEILGQLTNANNHPPLQYTAPLKSNTY